MFLIRAIYKDSIMNEVIDTAENLETAQMVAFEYKLAYGHNWLIYVEEKTL